MAGRRNYLVNAEKGLRLRATPSEDGEIIAILPFGLKITVDQDREAPEGWTAVESVGYVMAKFLK